MKAENKRILLITHGFYPEQTPRAFRATELAKEFCRQGHHVTVMAPEKKNVQILLDEFPIEFISLGKLNWKIPKINRMGAFGNVINKITNRSFPLFFAFPDIELIPKIHKVLKSNTSKWDVVISIAVPYPIHWSVATVWKNKKGSNIADTWIADCGDPYCIQENDTYQPPFYFHWIEKWFMRKVDFVTVPTNTSFKGYFPEFHSKIKVIPQGFRFDDIIQHPTIEDGTIRFGYGGSFILGKRDPKEFLEFLVGLDSSFSFEFHVFTTFQDFILPYSERDKRIILHPPMERKKMLEQLSTFNFVVNFANQGTTQTPSKLIDYAIIDKPILNIETGNFNSSTVLEFLNQNYQSQFKIADKNEYRIENVTKSFLRLIDNE